MKIPEKIKSGTSLNTSRNLPEIFYIILLTLDGILKRYGFKDAELYKIHNKDEEYDFELISSGIMFNLFSDYGIGKMLEPLIEDFFRELELCPEKYKNNIFYKEIVRLVPETLPLIREANTQKETEWIYEYAIKGLKFKDELQQERLCRIEPLLGKKKKSKTCKCEFCIEFRRYHKERTKHIDYIIINVLKEIDRRVNSGFG